VFGYLKKHRDFQIVVDSRDPIFSEELKPVNPDWSRDYFDDGMDEDEETDPAHPPAKGGKLALTYFVDADHAHDQKTRRSAMRTATEEIISMRYILRSLGVPVDKPTIAFGDNMSVIMNCQDPQALCKKKHNSLSFHRTREAIARNIVFPQKILSADNYADIFTKPISVTAFLGHVRNLMWKPNMKH
jgi:hypothetical protein